MDWNVASTRFLDSMSCIRSNFGYFWSGFGFHETPKFIQYFGSSQHFFIHFMCPHFFRTLVNDLQLFAIFSTLTFWTTFHPKRERRAITINSSIDMQMWINCPADKGCPVWLVKKIYWLIHIYVWNISNKFRNIFLYADTFAYINLNCCWVI